MDNLFNGGDDAAAGLLAGALGFVFLAIGIAIMAAVCWFLFDAVRRVPPEHRRIEPGLIWLLLVPCVGVFWMLKALPDTSRSFQGYFASTGDGSVGDCGEKIAWWTAGTAVASFVLGWVPLLNLIGCLSGPASLVLLVIFLIKVTDLKNRIPIGA